MSIKIKIPFKISIKQRIYWSFLLMVILFVINGIVTILTLKSNKKSAINIFKVLDPSIQALDDFKTIMLESKIITTNQVFLKPDMGYKKLLENLHDSDYAELKSRLNVYSSQWSAKNWVDSVNMIYAGFGELLAFEKNIIGSLKSFRDDDDPAIKLAAERKVAEVIIPRTTSLMNSLKNIHSFVVTSRAEKGRHLERSSTKLRMLILVLIISIIIAGFFLSIYMTKAIVEPINKIRLIVNDLGKGIIRKKSERIRKDEIGEMIRSVNNLSEKLSATAAFANEIGKKNFDSSYEPLSSEDTLGRALITMRDNLRANEANLEANNKELERKNKELEQFAYVASHDMQEPLRTTSSFVELLQQQYKGKLDNKADKYLNFIAQSSDRMKVLIKDLLDFSRIGKKTELAKVDCNITLDEVLADLGTAINETCTKIESEQLPSFNAYPTELKQLFQNLIINAIKFRKKNISPQINISVKRIDGYWQFAFKDNGIGIEEKHKERIFQIFQRLHTRNEYEGSGIGLSHCKKIVELHKGKLWVESTLGEGSIFYFTISASAEQALTSKIQRPGIQQNNIEYTGLKTTA